MCWWMRAYADLLPFKIERTEMNPESPLVLSPPPIPLHHFFFSFSLLPPSVYVLGAPGVGLDGRAAEDDVIRAEQTLAGPVGLVRLGVVRLVALAHVFVALRPVLVEGIRLVFFIASNALRGASRKERNDRGSN